ncbi:MAG TPA: hypothetical protein VJO16_19345 [Candidatus Acidoferrum sp.]|nr:hypothetical protein [Candidatus Acidoferrum sp.]
MSMKEKVLILWILAMAVFNLVFHQSWAIAFEALGRIIATNFISLPGLAKFTAEILGMFFLN